MDILITSDLLKKANIPEDQARLELAIFFFEKGMLTLGKASAFAGIHRFQLQKELASREIPMSYDLTELEKDLATINKMKQKP